jgi:hypothetical protein
VNVYIKIRAFKVRHTHYGISRQTTFKNAGVNLLKLGGATIVFE